MDDCKTLKEYSLFVAKVRKCIKEDESNVKTAITRAVDDCINDDILKDFLLENREEVIEMGVLGYNAEKHLQVIQDESFDDGIKVGIELGSDKRDEELDKLYTWLFANNRGSDVQKASSDSEYKKKLFDEYEALRK